MSVCKHELGVISNPPAIAILGRAKNSNLLRKSYISGIVADLVTKFAVFTDEDSVHIFCKFY